MVFKNKLFYMNLIILRLSCFLRNRIIGGILDRLLYLLSDNKGYEVWDDIMILINGFLVILGNIILYFFLRFVMVV